jgi:hypothetical protein
MGDVTRWHASRIPALRNSGDTVNAHHKRCGALARHLFPGRPDAFYLAVENRDTPEFWLGDPPAGIKERFPDTGAAYRTAESVIIRLHGIPQPANERERLAIKLVDHLDAYLWMLEWAPEQAESDGWDVTFALIMQSADDFAVRPAVTALLKKP